METVVDFIDRVLVDPENEFVLAGVAREVHELMQGRALFNA